MNFRNRNQTHSERSSHPSGPGPAAYSQTPIQWPQEPYHLAPSVAQAHHNFAPIVHGGHQNILPQPSHHHSYTEASSATIPASRVHITHGPPTRHGFHNAQHSTYPIRPQIAPRFGNTFQFERTVNYPAYTNTATSLASVTTPLSLQSSAPVNPLVTFGNPVSNHIPPPLSPNGSISSIASSSCSDDLYIFRPCSPEMKAIVESYLRISLFRNTDGFRDIVNSILQSHLENIAHAKFYGEALGRLIFLIGEQRVPAYSQENMRLDTRNCIFNKFDEYLQLLHRRCLNNYVLDAAVDNTPLSRNVAILATLIGCLFKHRVLPASDVHRCWTSLLSHPPEYAKNQAMRCLLENCNYRLCRRAYWTRTSECFDILLNVHDENKLYGFKPDHPNSVNLQKAVYRVRGLKIEAELKDLMRSPP